MRFLARVIVAGCIVCGVTAVWKGGGHWSDGLFACVMGVLAKSFWDAEIGGDE